MISLMFALLASPMTVPTGQAVSATLQSCAMEGGRWVCRYAVPDIEIVPIPGRDIVANAPASVLGAAPSVEASVAPPSSITMTPVNGAPTSPAVTTTVAPPNMIDPGLVRPIDAGVLTEREAQLVARCADAGWMSLCLPDDRRAARTLRDKQETYQAVRRDVTRLLGESRCDAAVRSALDGGYLSLARETRDYCNAPAATTSVPPVVAEPARTESGTAAKVEAEAEAETTED